MEQDSLVQSSFVIPCSTNNATKARKGKSRALEEESICSPLLAFETDERGARWRQIGYQKAVKGVRSAFDRVYSQFHQDLIEKLENILRMQDSGTQYHIPGPSRLTVACVSGAPLPERLSEKLLAAAHESSKDLSWVYLHPRECLDLATTLRIITARALSSRKDLEFDNLDFSDLLSIATPSANKHGKGIHIFIDNFAIFHHGVFNDLMQSLHSVTQMKGGPQFIIVLSSETGRLGLDDKLDPGVSPLLDVHVLDPVPATTFFEKVVEEILDEPMEADKLAVWPGDKVLEFARRRFYEEKANLGQIQTLFELYLHHHFTQQPLSALFETEQPLDRSAWKPAFFTRLRDMLLRSFDERKGEMQIKLPFPVSASNDLSKQEYLQEVLQNDYCLAKLATDVVSVMQRERAAFVAGARLAHLLRNVLRINKNDSTSNNHPKQDLLLEPRRSTFGGLLCALLSPQQAGTVLQEIRAALRMKYLSDFEAILEQIRAENIIQGTDQESTLQTIQNRLANTATAVEGENDEKQTGEDVLTNGNDGEAEKEARRLALVQKNLLREESNSALRRQICDQIVGMLRSLLNASSPFSQIGRYNSTGYLHSVLEPSPRINYLAALKNPDAYLTRTSNAIEMPDICRAYQTYEDAGRLINLADWFNAFQSSINDADKEEENNSDARKRKRLDTDGLNDLEAYQKDLASWDKKDIIRLRFALAVHEMGKMGFLKRTRRKPEHVLKLVYDLPLKD
ncbi:uncharacterized protein FA14DRAFT_189724 [Meira miltonrushii]|uniref:Uncharacterized protein n=1 Tax=Meira miltonrushii TaxID=1280837 RepID=A0A316VE07_9BASI|nr:uncharacterized protein FA14DRAFT_189724 [Meira miltonrushii]PWN35786.1 hypothetical protein FA14DRAFT_189724 [Meira miltonrushii]